MGNVQSETTPDSETAREEEEKANPDRSKPDRGLKDELGSQAPEQRAAVPPLSSEPGGGDRPTAGAAEMGKNHSKKSKLKLSSMWAQNVASGGMKEASLSEKEPGAEKRGLACLSRADLQGGQGAGPLLQEEPKGLKVALRPPQAQAAAPDPKDLKEGKRAAAKGKGKPENGQLAKGAGELLLLPSPLLEKPAEPDQATEVAQEVAEKGACWSQHVAVAARAKECPEKEGRLLEPLPPAKRLPAGSTDGLESPTGAEGTAAGPRAPGERSASRPAPSSCAVPPGGKKALLAWEKEPAGPRDGGAGSDGDSKGPALAAQLPAECVTEAAGPVEKPQAWGGEAKTGGKSEALGAEAVSSETMQELLEKGLNFLYKVTIQPGQWPPRIKAVKQKASVISSGVSYADVLKQCPQKKSPAGAPGLPKALHHLTTAGKKISSFKGLERSPPEDFSSLSQLFLEHFKKVTPKELAPHPPGQPVVTFLEELSTANTKRPEWQRPRPPTPYPQRRKGQGRKLPKFGTTVSQVVAFLGSDPKCDWFVHDESQLPLDEAAAAAEDAGRDHADPPGPAEKGAEAPLGTAQPAAALLLEPELAADVDEVLLRSRRRPQAVEEEAKESVPPKSTPYSPSCGTLSPLAPTQSFQRDPPPPALLPASNPLSPSEALEGLSPAGQDPCAPAGPPPDQKVPAVLQARPKIRKPGATAAPKSKEKLKASGPPKAKVPEGKGRKLWPHSQGTASPLRLEGVPLFPPFEKVARPFYFGEPSVSPAARLQAASASCPLFSPPRLIPG